MSAEEIFEQRIRLSKLFSLYGSLLTEKQYQCLSYFFDDDYSLSEIADELQVSRQAVHDLLKRMEQTLERYEAKLHLLEKHELTQEQLRTALKHMQSGQSDAAIAQLEQMLIKAN